MKKEEQYNHFGAIVRLCRFIEELSVKDLALKMNVASSYICDVEAGRKRPGFTKCEEFAEALNIPFSSMIESIEYAKRTNANLKNVLLFLLAEYLLMNPSELTKEELVELTELKNSQKKAVRTL